MNTKVSVQLLKKAADFLHAHCHSKTFLKRMNISVHSVSAINRTAFIEFDAENERILFIDESGIVVGWVGYNNNPGQKDYYIMTVSEYKKVRSGK